MLLVNWCVCANDAGGDSKTLMFVQISPSEHDVSETLSSLNFATRVRGVELGPARKQVDTGEIQKMKAMVWLLQVFFSSSWICLFGLCVTAFLIASCCTFKGGESKARKPI